MSTADRTTPRSLSLGSKVTLCVALAQIPLLLLAAFLHIRTIREDYMGTVEWRSQALAQGLHDRALALSSYSPKMQRTLGLNVDCEFLLEENSAGNLVHAGVIGANGQVIAHTEVALLGLSIHGAEMQQVMAGSGILSRPDDAAYHVFIPVQGATATGPVAVIDIGFSRVAVDQKIRDTIAYALASFLVFLLLSFLLISGLLRRFVTNPIANLSNAAVALAKGDLGTPIQARGADEVSLLAGSLERMRKAVHTQINDLNHEVASRVKAQRLLGESEEDLRVTLDSIADAVIATDVRGGVTRMNPVAEKLTGWSTAEAFGKPLEQIFIAIKAVTRDPVDNPADRVLATGDTVGVTNHTVLIASDGTERQIAHSGSPIRNSQGAIVGVVLVFRDVTEEYALQERLQQSEKMDAIGQLAGGVAHDFNNMLVGITGAAELLGHELPKTETNDMLHDIIMQSADRAAGLTRKLLMFARKQPHSLSNVDAHQPVREAVALLQNTVDKRIRIKTDLSAKASHVAADFAQLQSAFLNLGINASHAMPEGGTISFRSNTVQLDDDFCTASSFSIKPGAYIVIEVQDTGYGIEPRDLPRIFEPFFTTKEQGKGTGLGLAATFGAVRQHHGMISAESRVGVGTSFHIYLPLVDEAAPTDPLPDNVIHGQGRILVVDDEATMRFTTKAILKQLGYEVELAENGAEGLAIYKQDPDRYDLVFLDMIMPEMNGRDCFTELLKVRPDVRVILCSGFAHNSDLEAMLALGLCGLVSKPFRVAELSQALHRALVRD